MNSPVHHTHSLYSCHGLNVIFYDLTDSHRRDRMVIGLTSAYAIGDYHY
jgi:hypothetical protein